MSFMLTVRQVRERQKSVTRRLGWWNLRVGEQVMAVEKCQGLPKGSKAVKICPIEIVSTCSERLYEMTLEDCAKEGFPEMGAEGFITMFCEHNGCTRQTPVNRIEFKYL